jgi:signal transduction histidine kinase/CheY-like chemotaxis protein
MLFSEYLVFAGGIGWLVALMMVAVVPSLPGGFGRRHIGWLFAFCATRIVAEIATVSPDEAAAFSSDAWPALAAIGSGMVLWEFARRLWNEHGRRRISAATHLVGAELFALVLAVTLALGDAPQPAWFAAIALAATILPGALGIGSAWLLWRCLAADRDARQRTALRTAALGLGAFALFTKMPGLSTGQALPPWIVVGGLGFACVALPAARTRFTIACAIGLMGACVLGPYLCRLHVDRLGRVQRERFRDRGHAAAGPLQGASAATFAPFAIGRDAAQRFRSHRDRLRSADPLLRDVTLWSVRSEMIHVLDDARFVAARPATAAELAGFARGQSFVLPSPDARDDPGIITVHVPLRADPFATPAAWLTLQYPAAPWVLQRHHARRAGLALCGAFAAFCVIGFVLAVRHALENAQQLAIERAQSADRAKTEFLAFLSHEMRTPLQTILGRTEFLQTGATARPEVLRHAAAIQTQGRLLLRLVNDLLDLGTLEAGAFKLRHAPFGLRATLAAVEDTLRSPAAAKQLGLALEVAPDVPDALLGDEARLRQILGNLLGNAVKYTTLGHVRLSVQTDASAPNATNVRLVFHVSDTGPGLPPDKIPQLFTLFTRLDAGDTFTREGTGVGLALVRRLCELMGGNVTAANRPEGGAEFTVRLTFPLNPEENATQVSIEPAAATAGFRILVAEDNRAAREFLVEALHALGHRAESVADGEAALAAAERGRFDAVLLDINLPGRDGVSIARELSARPNHPRLIGCSAEAFAHTRETALAAGMDAFLEKPVSVAALAEALAVPVPANANLFARLQHAGVATRTRELLAAEWPERHAAATRALAVHDIATLHTFAHYLQSSALLAGDAELLELCRRLSAETANGSTAECRATIAALDQLVGGLVPPR